MADDRFADYNPAPLNQSGFDRFTRSTANAAVSGVKGVLAGVAVFGLIVGGLAAGAVGIAGAGPLAIAGVFAGTALGSVLIGATVGLPVIGGLFSLFGIAGGAYGAFKGYGQESQRAGLDNGLYNVAMAEAVSRGAAEGQATAYFRANQAPAPVAAPIRQEDVALERKEIPGEQPKVREQPVRELATMNEAGSSVAKDSVQLQGAQNVSLSQADRIAAASNDNRQMAQAI